MSILHVFLESHPKPDNKKLEPNQNSSKPQIITTKLTTMASNSPISTIPTTPNTNSKFPFLSPPKFSLKPNQESSNLQQLVANSSRREFLNGSVAILPLLVSTPLPSLAKEIEVGSYLPKWPTDPSFVLFTATPTDTPALRAGNVQPYKFILPPSWKQLRVANILSGNYCQPKCAEPWVEVKFEDGKMGKIQVVASPLIRLTNKPNATIEDIGSPEKLISSLGPFVTGNTLDPDELLETSIEKRGDQTYYKYVLETPFALTGSHNLAKATAKGNTVILFVVSASDKQWQSSEKTLQAILDSFEV